jgi:hypothetical protein
MLGWGLELDIATSPTGHLSIETSIWAEDGGDGNTISNKIDPRTEGMEA